MQTSSEPIDEMNKDNANPVDSQQTDLIQSRVIEQTNLQTQQIEDEVRRQQALVGLKEPISGLAEIYDSSKSSEYHQKSKELAAIYGDWRRIRGDGCCFYRALLCAQLETVISDSNELKRFTTICKGWRERLFALGFPKFTTGDFCDWFDELLDDIAGSKFDQKSLNEALNDEGRCNYYVTFFRLVTSGYLRENSATYSDFVEGGRTIVEFCQSEIEPMFKDCDHLALIGLTNALELSIRIEYMDRTTAPNGGWHYDFIVDGNPIQHHFLYRPGHYDIIYKKS